MRIRQIDWIRPFVETSSTSTGRPMQGRPDAWGRTMPLDLLAMVQSHLERAEHSNTQPWMAAWYDLIGWTDAADRLWRQAARLHLRRIGCDRSETEDLVRAGAWLSVGMAPRPPETEAEASRWICEVIQEIRGRPLYIAGGIGAVKRWFGLTTGEIAQVSRRTHPHWGTIYMWLRAAVIAMASRPNEDPTLRVEDVWALRTATRARSAGRWNLWDTLRRLARSHPTIAPPDEIYDILRAWNHEECPICLKKEGLGTESRANHIWTEHLVTPLRRCRVCHDLLSGHDLSWHPCLCELPCALDGTDPSLLANWSPRGFRHCGNLVTLHSIRW